MKVCTVYLAVSVCELCRGRTASVCVSVPGHTLAAAAGGGVGAFISSLSGCRKSNACWELS